MTAISRRLLGVAVALGLMALAACNLQNLQAPGLAADKDQAARNVFKAMQKGDLAGIPLGPEMSTPEAQAAIPQIFAVIPKGEPTKVRLVSWKTNWSALSGPRSENMDTTHEYTFGTNVLMVETVMQRDIPASGQPGPWKLRGFHFKPANAAATPPAKGDQPPATPAGPATTTGQTPGQTPTGQTPTGQTGTNQFVEQPSDTGAAGKPAADDGVYAKPAVSEGELRKPTNN